MAVVKRKAKGSTGLTRDIHTQRVVGKRRFKLWLTKKCLDHFLNFSLNFTSQHTGQVLVIIIKHGSYQSFLTSHTAHNQHKTDSYNHPIKQLSQIMLSGS